MSKYNKIKTAADLITEVRLNGLSTEQEDKNRAADIFGRSSVQELADLANDVQCKNADGFSTGKPSTSRIFYSIAYSIWNWEDATRFFNEHTNPFTKDAKDAKAKLVEAEKEVEFLKASLAEHKETILRLSGYHEEIESARREINELKAKLYDVMTAESAERKGTS